MERDKPAVGHLISPYLFATGSWIHSQLRHARMTRPVVLAQSIENPEAFPFEPVHVVTAGLGRVERLWNRIVRRAGSYRAGPYREAIAAEQVRLLHGHTGWEAARAAPVARAMRLPLVVSFYGRDVSALPRSLYWRLLYRRLFRIGELFLVEGPALATSLMALGCSAGKIRVVHLGVDLAMIPFRERRPHAGPVTILMSCSLREKKGVRYALEALAACRGPGTWRLRILGDGPLRGDLEARARGLGLADRVHFEGYVSYATHLRALDAADLFLSPSVRATDGDSEGGAPVALIEAQAAGLPAIATRHCDIPEVVQDGVTGRLVAERDVRELARAIRHLLSHTESWAEMGRAARAHVAAEFDAARQAARTEQLYLELLDSADRSRSLASRSAS